MGFMWASLNALKYFRKSRHVCSIEKDCLRLMNTY
jgi:hypothetical protein